MPDIMVERFTCSGDMLVPISTPEAMPHEATGMWVEISNADGWVKRFCNQHFASFVIYMVRASTHNAPFWREED